MTSAVQADLSEPKTTLAWITRQAEGQVGQLSPPDQAKIAQALVRPLPRNRCELIDNLAHYRVYHFRASKTLRISCRPTEWGLCVIHVGKHSEFDRFARHFAGQAPTNLIPLQESLIMKNQQHGGKNGATKALSTQAIGQPPHRTTDEDEQLLIESLRDVITKAIEPRHKALASDWAGRLDAMRKDLDRTVQECARKIAQQDSRLNSLSAEHRARMTDLGKTTDEIGRNQQELTTQLAQIRSDFEDRWAPQRNVLEQVQTEVARHAVQAGAAHNEVEQRVTALNHRLSGRMEEIGSRLDALAGIVESRQRVNDTGLAGLKAKTAGTEQTLGSLDQVLRGLAGTAEAQQQTITRLQEALTRVSAQVMELGTPTTKGGWWRTFWTRVRQFGWRPVRTAIRRA